MADSIFSFISEPSKDDVLKAILNVQLKAWEKQKGAEADKPTIDQLKKHYDKYNDGSELTAENALFLFASGNDSLHNIPNTDNPMTKDQAKNLGAVLLRIEKNNESSTMLADGKRPDVTIKGDDGVDYKLEPKELSAYLQSVKDGKLQSVNKWAESENIGLTGMGTPLPNGEEEITIETSAGQHRTFGNGKISKPIDGYYGDIDSIKAGDGDGLDIYISKEKYDSIRGGTPYTDSVFVMQEMDKGKADELKIGYVKDVDEFRNIQKSTFEDPAMFEKDFEGKYAKLTQEQYKQLKTDIAANPKLTLQEFVEKEKIAYIEPTATPTPATPEPTTPEPAKVTLIPETYTPEAGEGLLAISKKHFGSENMTAGMLAFMAVNDLKSPKDIRPDRPLQIPTDAQLAESNAAVSKAMEADSKNGARIMYSEVLPNISKTAVAAR